MEQPRRIQRKRSKGFKMPPNTVYVGRPSKWGNPFGVGQRITGWMLGDSNGSRITLNSIQAVLTAYKRYMKNKMSHFATGEEFTKELQTELKGKNLACWCKLDEPCHADILLKLANK